MDLMKELHAVCDIKTTAVFSVFNILSIADYCTEHSYSFKAAVKLLFLLLVSNWTIEIWHIQRGY